MTEHQYIKAHKSCKLYTAMYKGILYTAPIKWWSRTTGDTTACIRARAREKDAHGNDKFSVEEILGIKPLPGVERAVIIDMQDVLERHKTNDSLYAVFSRTKLVGVT